MNGRAGYACSYEWSYVEPSQVDGTGPPRRSWRSCAMHSFLRRRRVRLSTATRSSAARSILGPASDIRRVALLTVHTNPPSPGSIPEAAATLLARHVDCQRVGGLLKGRVEALDRLRPSFGHSWSAATRQIPVVYVGLHASQQTPFLKFPPINRERIHALWKC